jgi:hypothetical protein
MNGRQFNMEGFAGIYRANASIAPAHSHPGVCQPEIILIVMIAFLTAAVQTHPAVRSNLI